MTTLTPKEQRERERLHHRWATRKATMKEMDRCRELDRKSAMLREGDPAFLLIDLSDDSEVGVYATLTEARRNAKKIPRYSIWAGRWDGESALDDQKRVAHCDPYDGDDDRVKQGLGMPNASEAAEDYQIDASQAGEDW